ncbi:MAG: hypothetical protein ACHP6J_04525 [Burkholderiales bacterium]
METIANFNNANRKQISRLAQRVGTVLIALSLGLSSGCSVYMATHQPDKKDTTLFATGTPRSLLLAEFGQPLASETREGKHVDVFSFVQGYSQGAKSSRAILHGVADVFTLGLWEVVGTPTESVLNGDKLIYEVTYDANDKVEKVVPIGKEASAKPAGQSTNNPFGASEGTK